MTDPQLYHIRLALIHLDCEDVFTKYKNRFPAITLEFVKKVDSDLESEHVARQKVCASPRDLRRCSNEYLSWLGPADCAKHRLTDTQRRYLGLS